MKTADIVVACLGKPKFVQGSWLKENAIVIDCGITPVQGIYIRVYWTSNTNRIILSVLGDKTRLYGDVDFESCKGIASWITPVPGGVGPLTVAMLMYNISCIKIYYYYF